QTAWSRPAGRWSSRPPSTAARAGRTAAGAAQGAAPSAAGTVRIRRAAGLDRSTAPSGSTTTTGSGHESIVACAVLCARTGRSGPGVPQLHVGLVHRQDRVGLALDVPERRQEPAEIEPRALLLPPRRDRQELLDLGEVAVAERGQRVGARLLAGQGDVAPLD